MSEILLVLMYEVTDRLWIGNADDAGTAQGITTIINCTPDIPFFNNEARIRYRVSVDDVDDPVQRREMALILPGVVRSIDTHHKSGETVLIHCRYGSQRSSCVVAAWLMFREQCWSCNDAIKFVTSKSPKAFLMGVVHFRQVLDDFDKRRSDKDMPRVHDVVWRADHGRVWQ